MLAKKIFTAMLIGAATTIGSIIAKEGYEKLSSAYNTNMAKMKNFVENIKIVFKNAKSES